MTESFLQVTGFDPLVVEAPPGQDGRGILSITSTGDSLQITLTDGSVAVAPIAVGQSSDQVAAAISAAIAALGLGTASTHAASDFDTAGAASSALTAAESYTDAQIAALPTGGGGLLVTDAGDHFTLTPVGAVTITDNTDHLTIAA